MGKINACTSLHFYDSVLFLGSLSKVKLNKHKKQIYPALKRIKIYIYID